LRDLHEHERQFNPRVRPSETMGSWYIDRLKQEITGSGGSLLVAERSDGVVGYAALTFVIAADERDELPHSYAEVCDLAVARRWRSAGVGSALLTACETLARDKGVDVLRLGVLARNSRARAFYLRNGLEEVYITLEKKLT
jgi:ribosomal protein S18 acetylase RimI-like enzyme